MYDSNDRQNTEKKELSTLQGRARCDLPCKMLDYTMYRWYCPTGPYNRARKNKEYMNWCYTDETE